MVPISESTLKGADWKEIVGNLQLRTCFYIHFLLAHKERAEILGWYVALYKSTDCWVSSRVIQLPAANSGQPDLFTPSFLKGVHGSIDCFLSLHFILTTMLRGKLDQAIMTRTRSFSKLSGRCFQDAYKQVTVIILSLSYDTA